MPARSGEIRHKCDVLFIRSAPQDVPVRVTKAIVAIDVEETVHGAIVQVTERMPRSCVVNPFKTLWAMPLLAYANSPQAAPGCRKAPQDEPGRATKAKVATDAEETEHGAIVQATERKPNAITRCWCVCINSVGESGGT